MKRMASNSGVGFLFRSFLFKKKGEWENYGPLKNPSKYKTPESLLEREKLSSQLALSSMTLQEYWNDISDIEIKEFIAYINTLTKKEAYKGWIEKTY